MHLLESGTLGLSTLISPTQLLPQSTITSCFKALHSIHCLTPLYPSGYNFPTLGAITPHLEPTASGPSTAWAIKTARRLNCTVAVGYPERTLDKEHIYNALVFVSASGAVNAHTRKSHLFYSDEVWAEEGPEGFFAGEVPLGPVKNGEVWSEVQMGDGKAGVKIAAGICMDINPYQFTAPWTAYEFTTHARKAKAELVVLSCAWLTHISAENIRTMSTQPDLGTLGYWVERFSPLVGPAAGEGEQSEVVLVIANRTGDEGMAERVGEVRYAGSSCVMGLRKGDQRGVRIWDILGKAEEAVLVVDTDEDARYRLGKRKTENEDEDESESTEDDQGGNER
jgi:protein N-terminal amidase